MIVLGLDAKTHLRKAALTGGVPLKGRPRRIAIVAMARKLLVALWRYLQTGIIPTGANLKANRLKQA